jgi:hypothetical protein
MSRKEAVSLLNQLISECKTFLQASIVSLTPGANSGKWGVNVKWIACGAEKDCLTRVANERGYDVVEEDGYTLLKKQ